MLAGQPACRLDRRQVCGTLAPPGTQTKPSSPPLLNRSCITVWPSHVVPVTCACHAAIERRRHAPAVGIRSARNAARELAELAGLGGWVPGASPSPPHFFSFSFSLVISSFTASSTGFSSAGSYTLYTTWRTRGRHMGGGPGEGGERSWVRFQTCKLGGANAAGANAAGRGVHGGSASTPPPPSNPRDPATCAAQRQPGCAPCRPPRPC